MAYVIVSKTWDSKNTKVWCLICFPQPDKESFDMVVHVSMVVSLDSLAMR